MDKKYTRNEIIELLPAYALGALDPDEMVAVDAFLQQDEALADRLIELEETVAPLAYAAPLAAAPKDSLSRLVEKIEVADKIEDQTSLKNKAAGKTNSVASIEPSWINRLLGHLNGWRWATAGFAALCLLLSIYTVQLRRTNDRLESTVQLLQKELNDESVLVADLYQADRIVSLPGTEEAPDASGIFYTQDDLGVFIINGLDPLPADQTYQLWLVPPGGTAIDAVSVGFLPIENNLESATQAVTVPADLLDFYIVDVSVEPAGGSKNLSGPVVIRGTTE